MNLLFLKTFNILPAVSLLLNVSLRHLKTITCDDFISRCQVLLNLSVKTLLFFVHFSHCFYV